MEHTFIFMHMDCGRFRTDYRYKVVGIALLISEGKVGVNVSISNLHSPIRMTTVLALSMEMRQGEDMIQIEMLVYMVEFLIDTFEIGHRAIVFFPLITQLIQDQKIAMYNGLFSRCAQFSEYARV